MVWTRIKKSKKDTPRRLASGVKSFFILLLNQGRQGNLAGSGLSIHIRITETFINNVLLLILIISGV